MNQIRLTLSALTLASFLIPLVVIMGSEEVKQLALGDTPNLEMSNVFTLPSKEQVRAVKSPLPIPSKKITSSKISNVITPQPAPAPAITPRVSTRTKTS